MGKGLIGCAVGVAGALFALAAAAHHSFAIFDHSRTSTLTGQVVSFQWTNPHGYLQIDVPGKAGSKRYTLELTSINMLRRAGWRSSDVHPGDHVTAVMAPMLTGEPGGLLLELQVPGGRKLIPPVPGINTFKRTP
ncbi:MAG TPA: DUF6152 family protein [Gammaproteobacteria bacterium]|nr:DUF6152 family protein [Gammaproteobacteria bacterium]